ncbi:hypothetical protein DPMN_061023 [Dreissena polymorpha]|uniref:Uncharacterized protein n=1 Tax=Dreissena polymorpha TaxID=45954 RepID=A0A9D4C693_DREPO|nr:hypothetical protein DPMN_061023 [Dreissena polymorpha]
MRTFVTKLIPKYNQGVRTKFKRLWIRTIHNPDCNRLNKMKTFVTKLMTKYNPGVRTTRLNIRRIWRKMSLNASFRTMLRRKMGSPHRNILSKTCHSLRQCKKPRMRMKVNPTNKS